MWSTSGPPGVRGRHGAAEAAGSGALPPPDHPFWREADAPITVLATIDALASENAATEAELQSIQVRAVAAVAAAQRGTRGRARATQLRCM